MRKNMVKLKLLVLSIISFFAILPTYADGDTGPVPGESTEYNIPAESINVRDPYIFADSKTGKYYLHVNASSMGKKGLFCYESKDLKNWRAVGMSFEPDSNFWGKRDFWAPDMFFIDGKYYIIATFSNDDEVEGPGGKPLKFRGCGVLVSDRPDDGYTPLENKPITPKDWMCLDGTIYEDADKNLWLIYCHEWLQVGNGEIIAQRISRDLKKTIGEPIVILKALDAPWYNKRRGDDKAVTDAGLITRTDDGILYLTWSSFEKKKGAYAIGVAVSKSGKVEGPWRHLRNPLNSDDGGHAMIFTTFDGKTKISYHSPNSTISGKNGTLKKPGMKIRDIKFKNGRVEILDADK